MMNFICMNQSIKLMFFSRGNAVVLLGGHRVLSCLPLVGIKISDPAGSSAHRHHWNQKSGLPTVLDCWLDMLFSDTNTSPQNCDWSWLQI